LHGFELFTVWNPATDIENDVANMRTHSDFHQTGAIDLAGKGKDFRALTALGSDGIEPIRPAGDDFRNVCQSFDIVDDRRLAEQTTD